MARSHNPAFATKKKHAYTYQPFPKFTIRFYCTTNLPHPQHEMNHLPSNPDPLRDWYNFHLTALLQNFFKFKKKQPGINQILYQPKLTKFATLGPPTCSKFC